MTTDAYAKAFCLLAELYLKRGGAPLNSLMGVADFTINDKWTAKLNGHGEPIDNVPAYSALVFCNGWLAGVIDPYGGAMLGVTEDELIAALETAL